MCAMRSVLVTGATGFVGSHLCDALLAMGVEVYAIDDLCTGRLSNLEQSLASSRLHFLEHDVALGIPAAMCLSFDWICHLASPASPPVYQRMPVHTLKVNTLGTMHVLEHAKSTGAKVLLASTSEVYGDPLQHPQCESYWGNVNPIGLRSCYDEGKRAAESLCVAYQREYGVQTQIIRIFNTYGPRMSMDDGRVISNFMIQCLHGKPLSLYGDGQQTRSFLYIGDLIEAIIRLLQLEHCCPPMNIGNPMECTITELAATVATIAGVPFRVSQDALPADDPRKRCPDISLAQRELQWTPTVNLSQGLRLTYEYFRQEMGKA